MNATAAVTLAAALFAAGASLVSVWLQSHWQTTSDLQRWRRDVERKLVSDMLALLDESTEHWRTVTREMMEARQQADRSSGEHVDPEHWAAANTAREQATHLISRAFRTAREIELVAGRQAVDASQTLIERFEGAMVHGLRAQSPIADLWSIYNSGQTLIDEARRKLVECTRAELHTEPTQSRLRQLLRGRDSNQSGST